MKKKLFTKVLAGMLMLSLFAGTLFTQKISAAGPDSSQKTGAAEITLGLSETGKTLGTAPTEVKSTYFKVRTKREYNLNITVHGQFNLTEEFEIQVWNNKGELIKSGSQSNSTWVYDKKNDESKNEFTLKNIKKGNYFIEIKEKGSTPDREYNVKVIPQIIDRVKNVKATQTTKGKNQVVVSWTPLKGDAISGYKVYRKIGNGKWKLVATVQGIKSKKTTVKATVGKTSYFKVRAFYFSKASDKNNFSRYSKVAKVKMK